MINDTVDILDARIFNIGINFTAVVNYDQEKFEALNIALTTLQEMFVEKFDVGQPIYITKIYDVLNQLDEIDDVVMGCAFPEGAKGLNIARIAAMLAGLPVTVPGQTINRFCSSGAREPTHSFRNPPAD